MAEFVIAMSQTPGISAAERRKRLREAYSILLDAPRRKTAAKDAAQSKSKES